MTAGWGETEVFMDVSPRRLARVLHRHLAEHGLLSFLGLLWSLLLKRNQMRNQMPASQSAFIACGDSKLLGRLQPDGARVIWFFFWHPSVWPVVRLCSRY